MTMLPSLEMTGLIVGNPPSIGRISGMLLIIHGRVDEILIDLTIHEPHKYNNHDDDDDDERPIHVYIHIHQKMN